MVSFCARIICKERSTISIPIHYYGFTPVKIVQFREAFSWRQINPIFLVVVEQVHISIVRGHTIVKGNEEYVDVYIWFGFKIEGRFRRSICKIWPIHQTHYKNKQEGCINWSTHYDCDLYFANWYCYISILFLQPLSLSTYTRTHKQLKF